MDDGRDGWIFFGFESARLHLFFLAGLNSRILHVAGEFVATVFTGLKSALDMPDSPLEPVDALEGKCNLAKPCKDEDPLRSPCMCIHFLLFYNMCAQNLYKS